LIHEGFASIGPAVHEKQLTEFLGPSNNYAQLYLCFCGQSSPGMHTGHAQLKFCAWSDNKQYSSRFHAKTSLGLDAAGASVSSSAWTR